MLRAALVATQCLMKSSFRPLLTPALVPPPVRQLSVLCMPSFTSQRLPTTAPTSLQLTQTLMPVFTQQNRTVTKYNIQSGKRTTVKAVIKSFYRLNWGIWIRTKVGRQRRVYRKSYRRRRRVLNHVFTNARQTLLLDKMVSAYWKRPKYWVDCPYEPYHEREEHPMTRRKPAPAHPPLEE